MGRRPTAPLVAQAVLLGMPVAAVGERTAPGATGEGGGPGPGGRADDRPRDEPGGADDPDGPLPGRWTDLGPAARPPRPAPLVVDLSSLWAGPVCARILRDRGATVVKVESTERPDGARRGPPAFFDRLHRGQRAVALAFSSVEGRQDLRDLLTAADVVIEASRPRALAQLGAGPTDLGADGPGLWISITGHGRSGPAGDRVGFGDDAAAAGGLVGWTARGPVFGGDALADPLTGLAAAAAWADAARRGGGRRLLVDLALADVAAWVAAGDGGVETELGRGRGPARAGTGARARRAGAGPRRRHRARALVGARLTVRSQVGTGDAPSAQSQCCTSTVSGRRKPT